MPASEARIEANRRNAALSTGPKTEEGKERSRANALKHGLTGAGVVMPQGDAAEVARRALAFASELNAEGEVGKALARRAALSSVRMERAADQQSVAMTQRIREVEADFVAPEGAEPAEIERLRAEAVRVAMFDPSKEATLARRYESAAERAFFRCLKELRQRERDGQARVRAEAARQAQAQAQLGSFLKMTQAAQEDDDEFAAIYEELNIPLPSWSKKLPKTPGIDLPVMASRPG